MTTPKSRTAALAVLLALALSLAPPPPPAAAALPVIDVANLTQNIRTALQTYLAIAQRVSMIVNQVRQIEAALKDLLRLENPQVREISWFLYDLAYLLRETEGLVYSLEQLDQVFRELFPGYEPADDLSEVYADRTHRTLETLRAALLSTQRMARTFGPSQAILDELTGQALAAQGNLEAQEAQSILTGFTAQEISKLLQQVAVLTNAQAVYFSNEIESRASAVATFETWLDDARRDAAPYETGTQFPLVPAGYPW